MVTRIVVALVVIIVVYIVNVVGVFVVGGGGFIFVRYLIVLEDITSLRENGSNWRLWKIHTCIHTNLDIFQYLEILSDPYQCH